MQSANFYVFLALDLAEQRAAEARAERLAALAHTSEPRTGGLRRAIARTAIAVARAADAEAVRAPLTTP